VAVFTNTSTLPPGSPPVTYSWDFGDSTILNSSSASSVSHTFASPGVYTVTLSAANPAGSGHAVQNVTVFGSPQVGFSSNPVSGTAPLVVQFSNATSPVNDPTMTYRWDFGDSQTSTLLSPLHIYRQIGVYTVTLIAGNTVGTNMATATACVTVTQPLTGSVVIQPGVGVTLTFNAGFVAVVVFPSDLSLAPLTTTYQLLSSDDITGSFHPIGASFSLQALASDGTEVTHFEQVYTITIHYELSALAGLDEHSLKLYYWNTATNLWQPIDGVLDIDNHTLTVSLNHMTRFALLAQPWHTYLPFVSH